MADAAETGSTTKSFQLTYSSSSESGVGPSGTNGSLGCGARLISDGTEILADGTTGQTNSSGVCSGSAAFTNTDCYSASAPSGTAAACASLSTTSFDAKMAIVTAADTVSVNSAVLAEINFDDLSALPEL